MVLPSFNLPILQLQMHEFCQNTLTLFGKTGQPDM